MKIGNVSGTFRDNTSHTHRAQEDTVFMDLFILIGVFNQIQKCPECGDNMTSRVDMEKKNGFSHYIVLQGTSSECEWKYCFHTSKKQGPTRIRQNYNNYSEEKHLNQHRDTHFVAELMHFIFPLSPSHFSQKQFLVNILMLKPYNFN